MTLMKGVKEKHNTKVFPFPPGKGMGESKQLPPTVPKRWQPSYLCIF